MAAILKNSSPTSAINTCNKIGKCVILVGPIKARFAGKRVGSNTNTNQNGNKNNENITPKKRTQRKNVPTAGFCLNSSACCK
ncbi:Uncharacterised protein [Streptococcus pneumoniae]|nr:Uncharacterised protein [Streptococcus pneumoniae]CJG42326.1 Uncharacterised protein [Streptococcus pneumoniae]CJH54795.1 Uncharacterised protein [Streptococcus pneumoniae]COF70888.1 Uncharacterised protein [Streptococcus pneumoniae]COG67463.1 Uncharacterised protein [Streptococcus pneumoniae]